MIIGFDAPQVDPTMTEYTALPQLMKDSSKSIGFMISLGKRFVDCGIAEIDSMILPKLKKMLPRGVWPRIIPGYGSLLWFSYQVSDIMLGYNYINS